MAGLRLSQLQHWAIGKLDVKGAFMYAPLPPHMHVLVRPPRSWVRLGFVREGELWVLRKAVYGLRIAPRAWGTERDDKLKKVTWKAEGKTFTLLQCAADSQVWRIVEQRGSPCAARAAQESMEQQPTHGLLICYVDDLLLLSPKGAMRDGLKENLKAILGN